MGDYALVKDEDGDVRGVWLQDEAKAENRPLLAALLAKHEIILPEKVRVVTNTHNDNGGCFCMFGKARAPGEKEE